jgi:parallel beta-helix repeat protein
MMEGKIGLVFGVLTLLIMTVFSVMLHVPLVSSASETIYIKADGSVYPSGAPISIQDNVTYTLTDNITSDIDGIVIERDNITLEGAGCILQGTGASSSKGIDLTGRSNVTIRNMRIKTFAYGIWLNMSSISSLHGNYVTNSSSNAVYLYESWNNSIADNNITDSGWGINLYNSWNCSIAGNNIANSWYGIYLSGSSNNSISENHITANFANGVELGGSWNNSIIQNNITSNTLYGILLSDSSNNTIHHNNFMDNVEQTYVVGYSVNVWDDGYPSGGNYWSNYAGNDSYCGLSQNELGSDGIGDTPYTINVNNTDRYPLTGPFNMFDAGTWNGIAYGVDVVSNSTVSGFYFNPSPAQPYISFNVTGESGTVGFCRVTIPKSLLWAEPEQWIISVDDKIITDYTVIQDENFTHLYFNYSHSTKTIQIIGTTAIPEFPHAMIMPLLMILMLLAIILAKKRFSK